MSLIKHNCYHAEISIKKINRWKSLEEKRFKNYFHHVFKVVLVMVIRSSIWIVLKILPVFKYLQLEGCIDDERQFKTAKRSQGTPQAPGDATILKRFFRDNLRYFSSQIEKNSIF